MILTAQTVAEHLNGEVAGNPETKVGGFARIEQAKEGDLCFLANPKYEDWLYKTKASVVIVNRSFTLRQPVNYTIVWVDDAYRGIASMLDLYATMNSVNKSGRERPSYVSWRAKVGKGCYIGKYAYISKGAKVGSNTKIFPQVFIGENVSVGDNCIIYPGAKIYAGCHVGNNCIIHSNAVIGTDGFGFAPDANKVYKKIPQIGNVIVEDDVEIGSCTTIDRATMNSTIIRKGVKLDNHVHIAHNVDVGENSVMAAMVGIAGSTKIGSGAMFGGQAGAINHLILGKNFSAGAQAGVMCSFENDGVSVSGTPAQPYMKNNRSFMVYKKLPEMQKELEALKREVQELKSKG